MIDPGGLQARKNRAAQIPRMEEKLDNEHQKIK